MVQASNVKWVLYYFEKKNQNKFWFILLGELQVNCFLKLSLSNKSDPR